MKCPRCGIENSPESKVCMNCATPLNVQSAPVYTQPQQMYQAYGPMQSPLKPKEKLMLPDLILSALGIFVCLVASLLNFINVFRNFYFNGLLSAIITVVAFGLYIATLVFVLLRKDITPKLVTFSMCGLLALAFLNSVIVLLFDLIMYSYMSSLSFFLGTFLGAGLMISVAVLSLLGYLKKNRGVVLAAIIVACITLAFIFITIIGGMISAIRYFNGFQTAMNLFNNFRFVFAYVILLVSNIRVLKSIPKPQPQPMYTQQYQQINYQQTNQPYQQYPQQNSIQQGNVNNYNNYQG